MNLADVEPERRADVALDEVLSAVSAWDRRIRRPAALTPREALVALEFEALFVCVAASNLAAGFDLTDEDRERLRLAYARIDRLMREAA